MYKVDGELFFYGITDSGRVPSREDNIQNLAKLVLLIEYQYLLNILLLGF